MQFLSEPTGGSDVAGAQTTAVRDGEEWVLNGSKIWTTGAWWSDWGLCLARTNWDVPKHRGLTRLHAPDPSAGHRGAPHRDAQRLQGVLPGVHHRRARSPTAIGSGEVDDGWTVGIRWMFYEKSFSMSPLTIRPAIGGEGSPSGGSQPLDRHRPGGGAFRGPPARDLIGEAHTLSLATRALSSRVSKAIATGKITDQAAALTRVMGGDTRHTNLDHRVRAGRVGRGRLGRRRRVVQVLRHRVSDPASRR